MRRTFVPVFIASLFCLLSCQQGSSTVSAAVPASISDDTSIETFASYPEPQTLSEQFSYISGYQMASTLSSSFSSFDMEYMMKGIYDALSGSSFYSEEESARILQNVQAQLIEEAQVRYSQQSEENLAAAESFLATNAHRSGVITLNDKIQYEILREGNADGKTPTENSTVSVVYQLVVLNGEVKGGTADSSNPSVYSLQNVIEGFRDVVLEMKEGEKVRAWIHPDLGYGAYGSGTVGPNQLLIFDIELVSVNS